MSNAREGSPKSKGSKPQRSPVMRTIFPRDATPEQTAEAINAMIRRARGEKK
jgi:hypothetical protein